MCVGLICEYTVLEEVYCVASILFELPPGYHHANSSLDRDLPFTAIASGTVRPLRVFGRSLPSVERCLSVGLRLAGEQRYSSLRAFGSDLRRASRGLRTIARPPMRLRRTDLLIDVLADRAVKDVTTKRASIAVGRAGVIVSLVRCAQSLGEPALLAVAGHLAGSALRTPVRSSDLVLEDSEHQIDRGSVGYGAAGIPYAMALLAVAQRNSADVSKAIAMFGGSIRRGFRADDLALGRLGVVVAISHLIRVTGGSLDDATRSRLMNWARRVLEATARNSPWSRGRGVAGAGRAYLGMAHGWAGLMFTASVFTAAASEEAPEWLSALVDWIRARRRVENGVTRWPVVVSGTEYWDGWCHGQAGHINALLSVYRITRSDEILRLACDLGRGLARRPVSSTPHLCCGSAGVGYAFLGLFAATGEPPWLRLAGRACANALKTCGDPDRTIDTSLWKGPWGVACLQADLLSQRFSSPPVFGWDDAFADDRV